VPKTDELEPSDTICSTLPSRLFASVASVHSQEANSLSPQQTACLRTMQPAGDTALVQQPALPQPRHRRPRPAGATAPRPARGAAGRRALLAGAPLLLLGMEREAAALPFVAEETIEIQMGGA